MDDGASANARDDALLVERARAGDVPAFAQLVTRYQDRVFNAAWRICGNHEDARDVTQDAFMRAYESLASFRGDSGFYTWVFRVAVNRAISLRRKASRRREVSLDGRLGAVGKGASGVPAERMKDHRVEEPDHEPDMDEMHGHIVRALQKLDAEFRAVIVLRDMEGLDYASIADILDVAPGTVKSRLHRARTALREMLAPVWGAATAD